MNVLDRFRLDGPTVILTGVGPGVGEHAVKADRARVDKAHAPFGAVHIVFNNTADGTVFGTAGEAPEVHRGLNLAARNAIKHLATTDASRYATTGTTFREGGRVGMVA